MKWKLIHFRLFSEWLAAIFFGISSVVLLSVYFRFTEFKPNIYSTQQIVALLVGIMHIVLTLFTFYVLSYTTRILRKYVSNYDLIYNGLMYLLGMDKIAIPIDFEADDERSEISDYREPEGCKVEISDVEKFKRIINIECLECQNESQSPFNFTYKQSRNLDEIMNFNEQFVSKLSSDTMFETFVLEKDGYPPIYDIVVEPFDEKKQSKAKSVLEPKFLPQPKPEGIIQNPSFLFTYKSGSHKTDKNFHPNSEDYRISDQLIYKVSYEKNDLEELAVKDNPNIEEEWEKILSKCVQIS